MEFVKPKIFRARLSEKYYLGEGDKYLFEKFELVSPNEIEFLAGQYVSIKVNEQGERRSYSILNTPDVDHAVSLVADLAPGGIGSSYLRDLEMGEEVELLGPMGDFVVNDTRADRLLFVATGSGITALYPMILDLLINKRETCPMRLHWGLRYERDIFWLDNFERLMEEHSNFVFDLVLSRPTPKWSLCSGYVQDCLKRDFREISEWEAYICGGKEMVAQVTKLLKEKGMNEAMIHSERFY